MKREKLVAVLPPVVFGIIFLLAWELFVVLRDIKPYLLPRPSAIWGQFHGNFRQIRKATTVTGTNAFIGLLLGISFGSITGSGTTSSFVGSVQASPACTSNSSESTSCGN